MTARHRFLEQLTTRDDQLPLVAGDHVDYGWRCVPVPPDSDPNWFIVDDSDDRRTVWARWHFAEGIA
jgi:hypothetical protein